MDDILEIDKDLEEVGTLEMDILLEESIERLKIHNNELWEFFFNVSVTELGIPDTAPAIKKYVVSLFDKLYKSNNRANLITLPTIKYSPKVFDQDVFKHYFEYFESEKECLKYMKKILTSKKELVSSSIGKYSTCGIFTCTIGTFHLDTQTKLGRAIDLTKLVKNGVYVDVNLEEITPNNYELVKKIGTAFKNEVNRKK